jgi:hypothetical protein
MSCIIFSSFSFASFVILVLSLASYCETQKIDTILFFVSMVNFILVFVYRSQISSIFVFLWL